MMSMDLSAGAIFGLVLLVVVVVVVVGVVLSGVTFCIWKKIKGTYIV